MKKGVIWDIMVVLHISGRTPQPDPSDAFFLVYHKQHTYVNHTISNASRITLIIYHLSLVIFISNHIQNRKDFVSVVTLLKEFDCSLLVKHLIRKVLFSKWGCCYSRSYVAYRSPYNLLPSKC